MGQRIILLNIEWKILLSTALCKTETSAADRIVTVAVLTTE